MFDMSVAHAGGHLNRMERVARPVPNRPGLARITGSPCRYRLEVLLVIGLLLTASSPSVAQDACTITPTVRDVGANDGGGTLIDAVTSLSASPDVSETTKRGE